MLPVYQAVEIFSIAPLFFLELLKKGLKMDGVFLMHASFKKSSQ